MKRTKPTAEKVVYVRVSPELHAAIKAAADRDDRTVQRFLERFLREHFLKGRNV